MIRNLKNIFAPFVREEWELSVVWNAIRIVEDRNEGWLIKDYDYREYNKKFTSQMQQDLKNFLSKGKSSLTPYEIWKLGLTGFGFAMSCPNTGMTDDLYTMGARVIFSYEDTKTQKIVTKSGIILRAGPSTLHEILEVDDNGNFTTFVPKTSQYSDTLHKNLTIIDITTSALRDGRKP